MAIKFVDVEPDDAKERKAKAVKPDRAAASEPAARPVPAGDDVPAGLPHAKPEPKARGRRTSAAADAAAKPAVSDRSEAKEAAETLPGLPVHAKPEPKPRGRKKAFG